MGHLIHPSSSSATLHRTVALVFNEDLFVDSSGVPEYIRLVMDPIPIRRLRSNRLVDSSGIWRG